MKDNKEDWNKCKSCNKLIPPGLNMMYICPTCLVTTYKQNKQNGRI